MALRGFLSNNEALGAASNITLTLNKSPFDYNVTLLSC